MKEALIMIVIYHVARLQGYILKVLPFFCPESHYCCYCPHCTDKVITDIVFVTFLQDGLETVELKVIVY